MCLIVSVKRLPKSGNLFFLAGLNYHLFKCILQIRTMAVRSKNKKVVVVGAGFAGLSAAASLARDGF